MNEGLRKDTTERGETAQRTLRGWWQARHRIAMEALFIGVVVMSVIGIALTNIAPAASYRYWLFTVGIFAIAAVLTGNLRAWEEHRSLFHVTLEQTVHWGITLLAVLIVHLMLLGGRLTFEATGLILMLLLGQAVALDGFHRTGWRFALLGLAIMVMALFAAWFAAYVWMLVAGGLLIWVLAVILDIYLPHPADGRSPGAP